MEYLVHGASLTAIADAIREKGGTTAPLSFPAGMAEAVRNIQSAGTFIFQAVEMCNIAVNKLQSSNTFVFQSTEMCNITVNTYYKEES